MISTNEIEFIRSEQKELLSKIDFWRTAARSGFADGAWKARGINPRLSMSRDDDGNEKYKDSAQYIGEDKWLVRNDFEGNKSFTRRLKVAKDFGYSEKIIRSYLAYFSRAGIAIESEDGYFDDTEFKYNIDGEGSSVQDFAGEIAEELLTVGQVYICTDRDGLNSQPYTYLIPAENVMDWEESGGSFSMIKWCAHENIRNGFAVECVRVVYLWTTEAIYKCVEIDKGRWTQTEMPNALGYIPVHYAGFGHDGWSLINTPAKFQLDMMNLDSEIRNILSRQAISILHMPRHVWDSLGILTADSVLVYDDSYKGPVPGFAAYPASGLDGHFQYIDRLKEWVHDLANIRTRSATAQSGISKQWDFFDTEAVLSMTAEKVEKLLIKCAEDWLAFAGLPAEIEIHIGKDFDIKNLQDELKAIMDLMVIGVGQTAEADLKKRARDLLLKYDGDKLARSNAEIDGELEPADTADAAEAEDIGEMNGENENANDATDTD